MPNPSDVPAAVTQLTADEAKVAADVARLNVDEAPAPAPPPGPALPDMIVTLLGGGFAGATAGTPITFTVTIKNQGTASPPATIFTGIGFYLDGVDITYAGVTQAIAPGATLGPLSAIGTWTATAGAHTLVAWVNDVARYPEVSTTNNKMTVTFNVVAAAVAKPINVTLPAIEGQAVVGDTLTCDPGTWK